MFESICALRHVSTFVLATVLVACSGDDAAPDAGPKTPDPVVVVDEDGRVPSLTCPGDRGCASNAGPLRVGVALRAITPVIEPWTDTDGNGRWNDDEPYEDLDGNGKWDGVWLAGFGNGRAATSVNDDIWARVLVLEQGDVSVALVTLDLVGLFHHDVLSIRQAAVDSGLDLDHILVATTHNHQGPDTIGIWGSATGISGYDSNYVATLTTQIVEALTEARNGTRAATLRVGTTEAPELVNDTREPFVIDQALTTLQFRDADTNSVIATSVFWGNHPEALGSNNTALTSDFPHSLRAELEEAFPGSPALFFNGSLGGLSTTIGIVGCPDGDGLETCAQGTFERAEYVGRGTAKAAVESLSGAQELPADLASLSLVRRSFLLTTNNGALALAFKAGLLARTLFSVETGKLLTPEETAAVALGDILEGTVALQTELNLLRLGPVAIAAVPGELYPELWLAKPSGGTYIERPVGADFPDAEMEQALATVLPSNVTAIIVNNANDALGYIIPKTQWDQVKPYAYVTGDQAQYGEANSLGPDTAATLANNFAAMMASGKD